MNEPVNIKQERTMEEQEESIDFNQVPIEMKIKLLEYYLEYINKDIENIKKQKNYMIIQEIIKSVKKNKFNEDDIKIKHNKIVTINGTTLKDGLLVINDEKFYESNKNKKSNKKTYKKLRSFTQ